MALVRILIIAVLCVLLFSSKSLEAAAVKEFHDWPTLQYDLKNTLYAMVDFFASWCSYCVTLAPIYEEAAYNISKREFKDQVKLIKVQCDDEKGDRKPICTVNNIQGFPTINIYKEGINFDQYKGDRSSKAIVKYIEELVKTGKPQFADKNVIDHNVCMAKDFKKYVSQN